MGRLPDAIWTAVVRVPLYVSVYRYFLVARAIDYVDRRAAWWAAIATYAAIELVVTMVDGIPPAVCLGLAVFVTVPFLIWRSIADRDARAGVAPPGFLVVLIWFWELMTWWSTLAAVLVAASGRLDHAWPPALQAVQSAIGTYMLIDLTAPPRPRRRVRRRVRLRRPRPFRWAPAPSPS